MSRPGPGANGAPGGRPPRLMGILNVTPDSFSDGGLHQDPAAAAAHGVAMLAAGADIIDVGGESTRPGASPVSPREQRERVIPVLRRLRREVPAATEISIDTTSAEAAAAALDAGATMINDVSAGRGDPDMFRQAAAAGVPYVLMHIQGTPATMQDNPRYDDVVGEIRAFLLERAAAAQEAGIDEKNIIIDPGIGFGKSKEHNLTLVANLDKFTQLGYPVLLGASRKRFMGAVCRVERYSELVGATCAATVLGALAGVAVFRVHDVKENRQALDLVHALRSAG